ncbi:hypothetical protein [Amycolatopsis japonica]
MARSAVYRSGEPTRRAAAGAERQAVRPASGWADEREVTCAPPLAAP